MKLTGIVRRVDDFGRILIPKEIRKLLDIKEGDPLEIYVDADEKCVCLRHYMPYHEPWRLLEDVADEIVEGDEDFRKFANDIYALAKKMKQSTLK